MLMCAELLGSAPRGDPYRLGSCKRRRQKVVEGGDGINLSSGVDAQSKGDKRDEMGLAGPGLGRGLSRE